MSDTQISLGRLDEIEQIAKEKAWSAFRSPSHDDIISMCEEIRKARAQPQPCLSAEVREALEAGVGMLGGGPLALNGRTFDELRSDLARYTKTLRAFLARDGQCDHAKRLERVREAIQRALISSNREDHTQCLIDALATIDGKDAT